MPPNFSPSFIVVTLLKPVASTGGPTEFFLGSHLKWNALHGRKEVPTLLACGNAGDVFLFDGRILHRGTANKTAEVRPLAMVRYARQCGDALANAEKHYPSLSTDSPPAEVAKQIEHAHKQAGIKRKDEL